MLKYLFITLSLLTLLGACRKDDSPEDLLSLEQMQHILMEFQLADAALERTMDSYDIRVDRREVLQDAILEKYDVPRQQFYDSYQYYMKYPDLYDTIYSRIIDSLNRMVPVEQEKRGRK